MKTIFLTVILATISTHSFSEEKKPNFAKCVEIRIAASIYGVAKLEAWARGKYSDAAIAAAKKCLIRT